MFRSPFSGAARVFLEVRWSFPAIRFLSSAPARLKGALAAANTPFRQGAFAPLHPPKAKAERVGQSFSSGVAPLSRAHSRSQRIASARDWNLCSKRKSSSLSSNSLSTTKVNKGLVRWPIHISPSQTVHKSFLRLVRLVLMTALCFYENRRRKKHKRLSRILISKQYI